MTRDDREIILDLRKRVQESIAERGWQQFHRPKNLSMAIAIEAAELMEVLSMVLRRGKRGPLSKIRAVKLRAE